MLTHCQLSGGSKTHHGRRAGGSATSHVPECAGGNRFPPFLHCPSHHLHPPSPLVCRGCTVHLGGSGLAVAHSVRPLVQVTPDGSMVRPLAMPPQSYAVPMPGSNTPYLPPMACVVFGEAMSEAPEEQVAALFQETCTPLTLMKGESNAWTAKFPSDDIAQKALRHVTQAEFKGQLRVS